MAKSPQPKKTNGSHASVAAHLRHISLFEHLPDEVLEKLAHIAHQQTFEEGAILFNENEPGDALYLVIEGTAIVQKLLDVEAKTYKDLAQTEAGGMFGEMALFDDMPRSATVRALSHLEVLSITRDEFQRFLRDDTATASVILGGIIHIQSNRLRESDQHMATLYEVGNIIAAAHEAADIAHRVMERLINTVFHVDGGAFCMWNVWMDECDVLYCQGVAPDGQQKLGISRSGRMAAFLREHRKPQVLKNLPEDHPLRQAFALGPDDSLLLAPLVYRDEVLGFILLAGRNRAFSSFHHIVVSSVCSQVASAITNLAYAKDAECRDRLEMAKNRHGPTMGRL